MPQETPEELPHRARVVPFRFENVGIINAILLPVRITIWVGVWVFALIATLVYSYLRSIPGADALSALIEVVTLLVCVGMVHAALAAILTAEAPCAFALLVCHHLAG